jgi:hypothetical protein
VAEVMIASTMLSRRVASTSASGSGWTVTTDLVAAGSDVNSVRRILITDLDHRLPCTVAIPSVAHAALTFKRNRLTTGRHSSRETMSMAAAPGRGVVLGLGPGPPAGWRCWGMHHYLAGGSSRAALCLEWWPWFGRVLHGSFYHHGLVLRGFGQRSPGIAAVRRSHCSR